MTHNVRHLDLHLDLEARFRGQLARAPRQPGMLRESWARPISAPYQKPHAADRPTLVFSPVALRSFRPARGKIYAGKSHPKFEEYKRLAVARPLTVMAEPLFRYLYQTSHCDQCRWQSPEHAQIHRECHFAGYPVNFEKSTEV